MSGARLAFFRAINRMAWRISHSKTCRLSQPTTPAVMLLGSGSIGMGKSSNRRTENITCLPAVGIKLVATVDGLAPLPSMP
jgi:hypothetical protein